MSNLIEAGVAIMLRGVSERFGLRLDENFDDTPTRISRMYDEILSGIENTDDQIREILHAAFPCSNDHLVTITDIEAFSLCPHHLLPVHYKIHVSYLPCGAVVGISKLVRLVDILAKRPVLQEQLTDDISSSLLQIDGCLAAACIVEGYHYCIAMRGVRQSAARTVTSSMKGQFLHGTSLKQEFFDIVYGNRGSRT